MRGLGVDRVGLRISGVFERIVPDPFVIAVFLTVVTAAIALWFGSWPGRAEDASAVVALLDSWRGDAGIWAFLAFSMQMCLILVTGYALAETRAVGALIRTLVRLPRSTAQAAFLVGFTACAFAVINWGLGLIVGAILARDVGRSLRARGIRAHYPLIVAAGYLGLLVWHGGLSGSAPLKASTRGELLDTFYRGNENGAAELARLGVADGIPLSETLGSPMNLVITAMLIVLVPAFLMLFAPKREEDMVERAVDHDDANPDRAPGRDQYNDERDRDRSQTIPEKLFSSPIVAWLLAVPLLIGFWRFLEVRGAARLGPNEIVMLMLAAGLFLHGSLRSYARSAEDGARACAGIILQFPLYAGIMGMLAASGLIQTISNWFIETGNETTIPVMTFFSAGLVNLFVPSGGGQWGIQGQIALEAAHGAGIEPGKLVMAVAWGDQLTNMLQPFWALPLLGIAGVKARDIVGYTALAMVFAAALMAAGLLLF